MSADRDYWRELKQLLRWYMIPGLVPQSFLAHPGSSGLVQACPSLSGLVRARLGSSGSSMLVRLVRAHSARSGLSELIWARLACQGLS